MDRASKFILYTNSLSAPQAEYEDCLTQLEFDYANPITSDVDKALHLALFKAAKIALKRYDDKQGKYGLSYFDLFSCSLFYLYPYSLITFSYSCPNDSISSLIFSSPVSA